MNYLFVLIASIFLSNSSSPAFENKGIPSVTATILENEAYKSTQKSGSITPEVRLPQGAPSLALERTTQLPPTDKTLQNLKKQFCLFYNQALYKEALVNLSQRKKLFKTIKNATVEQQLYILHFQLDEILLYRQLDFLTKAIRQNQSLCKNLRKHLSVASSNKLLTHQLQALQYRSYSSLAKCYDLRHIKNNDTSSIDSVAFYLKKAAASLPKCCTTNAENYGDLKINTAKFYLRFKDCQSSINLLNEVQHTENKTNKIRYYFEKANFFETAEHRDSTLYYAYKFLKGTPEHMQVHRKLTTYQILARQYSLKGSNDSMYKYSELAKKAYLNIAQNKEQALLYLHKTNRESQEILTKKIENNGLFNQTIHSLLWGLLLGITAVGIYLLYQTQKPALSAITASLETSMQPLQGEPSAQQEEKTNYKISPVLERQIIEKINDAEEKHAFLAPNFNISAIAEALQTNTTYVSFVFNKYKKQSFTSYFTLQKINYIVALLEADPKASYTVSQLAHKAGYSNAAAFSRAFKKATGQSPSQFMALLQEKNNCHSH